MLRLLVVLGLLLNAVNLVAGVVPLTAKEVSLMLRSGYSSQAVLQELSKRKFADTFDSSLEKEFIKAGAKESLIDAFRIIDDADLVGTYRRKMAALLF